MEPSLRDPSKINHVFILETIKMLKIDGDGLMNEVEVQAFRNMVVQRGCALAFSIEEVGCVCPKEVIPMVIFIVPHLPWDLKSIPIPKVLFPK